jgi:hypothetical protein
VPNRAIFPRSVHRLKYQKDCIGDLMRIEAVAANLIGQRDLSGAFDIAFSIRKWALPQLATCRG